MNVGNDDGGSDLALLDLLPKQVRVDPMFQRKSRYRNAKLKACRHKTLLRGRLKAPVDTSCITALKTKRCGEIRALN